MKNRTKIRKKIFSLNTQNLIVYSPNILLAHGLEVNYHHMHSMQLKTRKMSVII